VSEDEIIGKMKDKDIPIIEKEEDTFIDSVKAG
jgi:hypothetical protein